MGNGATIVNKTDKIADLMSFCRKRLSRQKRLPRQGHKPSAKVMRLCWSIKGKARQQTWQEQTVRAMGLRQGNARASRKVMGK